MRKGYNWLLLLIVALNSCKGKVENESNNVGLKDSEKHWTYEGETGPEHWVEIEKNSDCDGEHQSPVNIIDIDAVADSTLPPLDIHYSRDVRIHDVTNNGHSIQYNFEKGDYVLFNNQKFELRQIHFHEASEHTINGVRYPLEMHMVHINAEGELLVLAIMAIEGRSSEPFAFLEDYLPIQTGETKIIDSNFDLNLNLPENREYYTYPGSLTTPPCTEGVLWFVFKHPITVSVEQVKELQVLMPLNNYRGEQPLNARVVKKYEVLSP